MIKLDPKDLRVQTAFLVGNFLAHWSILESQINRSLGDALGLSDVQRLIVTRNMQFRDKINAFKAIMSLYGDWEPATKITDALNQAADLANTSRNVVAHETFWATGDGAAVEFSRIQAKGTVKFPSVVWTPKDFATKIDKMAELGETIKAHMPSISLVEALRAAQKAPKKPNAGLFGLGLLSSLPPLPQSPPGDPQATPQIDVQTLSFEKE